MIIRTLRVNDIVNSKEFNLKVYYSNAESTQDYYRILNSFLQDAERSAHKYLTIKDPIEEAELAAWAKRMKIPVLEDYIPPLIDTEEMEGELLDQLNL